MSALGFQLLEDVQACAIGQAHVGDDRAVAVVLQQLAGLFNGAGGLYVVAFAQEGELIERTQIRFVVDDQQSVVGWRAHAA